MATKKPAKKTVAKKATTKKSAMTKSMPLAGKNPKGGLTAAGRAYFAKTEGSHLKPGVTGAADTPEKMRRKGSFLTRMFTHPRGPMLNEKGEPTRLALSAHAWGEPVPKTMAAAKKLAAKGAKLLDKYEKSKTVKKAAAAKKAVKKGATKKSAAKRTAKKAVSRR